MNSSLIGKIEKAKRYAQERDRVSFTGFTVDFRGDHDVYKVGFEGGQWRCSCDFFSSWGLCSHTMTMEKILEGMLAKEALSSQGR